MCTAATRPVRGFWCGPAGQARRLAGKFRSLGVRPVSEGSLGNEASAAALPGPAPRAGPAPAPPRFASTQRLRPTLLGGATWSGGAAGGEAGPGPQRAGTAGPARSEAPGDR